MLEPLAKALDISVIELLAGEEITNQNQSFNMVRAKFYICPVCGNVIQASGEAVISCCGITLPPVDPETTDAEHLIKVSSVEDEYYVTVEHPMNKAHYISFLAGISDQGIQFVKLYPEGCAEARFKMNHVQKIYAYCNRHGMFQFSL